MASASSRWFLLYCETDDSHSVVEESAVMNAECVAVTDDVTFFYGSRSYVGQVIMIDEDRDLIDEKLSSLGKKAKRVMKPKGDYKIRKRRSARPNRFCPSRASTPESSQAKKPKEKSSKTVANNVASIGAKAMNQQVLEAGGTARLIDNCDVSSDSQSDTDPLAKVKSQKLTRKDTRKVLLAKIKKCQCFDSDDENCQDSPKAMLVHSEDTEKDTPKSPTKEELKIMLLQEKSKVARLELSMKKETGNELLGTAGLCGSVAEEVLGSDLAENDESQDAEKSSDDEVVVSKLGPSSSNASEHLHHGGPETTENKFEPQYYEFEYDNEDATQQLGKDLQGHKMVLLVNNIYCRKDVLDSASSIAANASQLVRRHLLGVFTLNAVVKSTLTGQRPRAAERNKGQDVSGLNKNGVNAIIEYARFVGRKRHWEVQSRNALRTSIRQKIGEVTRDYKKKN